jgi:hypothetical protein
MKSSLFSVFLKPSVGRGLALAGLLALCALPARAENLLINGDFAAVNEAGLPTNWTPENAAAIAIDLTQFPPDATRSLGVATQDEGTSSLGYVVQSLNVAATGAPLLPNAHYVARVWVRSTVDGLARIEVKRFNGGTELERIDSGGSTGDWSRIDVNFDTGDATRIEVQLRYKKSAVAAGQTAWFANAELITADAAGGDARLSALTLVPTFESIGAYIDYSGTYTSQAVELDYRVAGAPDWLPALTPPAYPADSEFRGSILLLQPGTAYEVRARLVLNGAVLDEKTTTVTTWADDVPVAADVVVPANSTGTYVITAQGSPTGWIRYRPAAGGSTIDVTGTAGATEAVVLDHAAYVIVEGLTIRGGTNNGMRIDNSHDIRVRDCDVSDWSVPGTFAFVNQGDLSYGYVDAAGVSINLRAGIRVVGPDSMRVVLERNLIHHPNGKSPSWAFGHPNGPEAVVLDTTGGNNVVRFNDLLAADGRYFNDAIESVQNGSVNGGPYRDTDIYGNLLQGANDDGTELDGGQMNVRYWHNWVEGGSGTVSTAPNLKGSSYIFRNILVSGDERGGSQAGSIKMGGAPGVTFLLQNTIVAAGYGLTSGHYPALGAVSPLVSRNNLFTGLLPGEGRVRLDEAVSGDFDYDLIPPEGVLPATFVPGPGREGHAVFAEPVFLAPDQRDFLLAAGSPGIAAGAPLANLTPAGVSAPDLGAVDTANQNEAWPIRPAAPETAPNLLTVHVRKSQQASASLTMQAGAATGATWTAHGGDAWLSVTPATGATGAAGQTLQCTVDATALEPGVHRSFVSIRTDTGSLRTVPVVAEVEPEQTLTYIRETETALPVPGFAAGTDANASGGGYVQAVVLQPGETRGEIGIDFTVPEAGTYYVLARVRATGPANLVPTQDSIVLRIDGGEDLRWDLWGIGQDVWSWNRAYVVPAVPTSDVIGRFTFTAGAHRIAVVSREIGAQVDQIAVSNDPFIPALPPGPVPVIFTAALPSGGEGVAYEQALLGGGEAPFTWTVIDGVVPDGLTLGSDGVIRGTPTQLGTGHFTVQVTDANGDTATRTFDLVVTLPPAATPVFSPGGGTYTTVQTVTITSATEGAAIYYTTDGSTPDEGNGTLYSGPVTIGVPTTLRAVAFKSGMSGSAVASATYDIDLPQAATPAFDPVPGTYNAAQTVAITSATAGATIRYTTDGSAPSATNGTVYSGPVTVSATTTLQAIASADGLLDSTSAGGTYTIGGTAAFQLSGGQVVMEAEHFYTEAAGAGQDWVAITQEGASGAATNNALQGLPNLGVGYPALDASLPRVDYAIDVPADAAGNYYVHVRDFGATSSDDSIYVSIDGSTTVSQTVTALRSLDWKTSGGTLALSAGRHTLTMWMREDGIVVDKIVLDTNPAAPTGAGPDESGPAAPASVAAPVFSPAGGTFDEAQSVTITTATDDATIRYTLDGSAPSPSAGTVYSGPVAIAETATLRAIAYLGDGTASIVTSDTYTIQTSTGGGSGGTFAMDGNQVVMEAEHFTTQIASASQSWVPVTAAGASGAASDNAMQALPNLGTAYPALDPTAARLEYQIAVPDEAAGNYYVHIRDVGASSTDDSVYVSIDASTTVSQVVSAGRTLDWKTSNARLALPAGTHTLTVWMREDGIVIDKIVVDGTSSAPAGFGPDESPQAPATTAPSVTTQPAAQTATVGDTVTLNVTASGDPAPTYQWRKDDSDLAGATSAVLTLANVTTADAGSYTVVVSNSAGSVTSDAAQVDVNPAAATVTLGGLMQAYDGAPKPVTATTVPAGLPLALTYDGNASPPTNPGSYTVTATIDDPDYTGTTTGTLTIAITALVRHAPVLNGRVDGSLQVLSGESFALNSPAAVTGDLLVPGTPAVRLNGTPTYGGTLDGSGSAVPSGQQITINQGAELRHLIRRTDPIALAVVDAPPAPAGTRDVALNQAGQSAGDFATLRNLTLNSNAGPVAVPPGTYGAFVVNDGSRIILGVAGATEPAIYNLQRLTLNSGAQLEIAGPVILTVAGNVALNGSAGTTANPAWLTLRVASGGVTLNGGATLSAVALAPAGTITINGSSQLTGRLECDRLTLNSGSILQEQAK